MAFLFFVKNYFILEWIIEMGTTCDAVFITTSDLEQKLSAISAYPTNSEEREGALVEILWGESSVLVCSGDTAFHGLDYYFYNAEKDLIPLGIRGNLRLFLGALIPMNRWNHPDFQESRSIGRTYPIFEEEYSDIFIWFLSEQDVKRLKELSGFLDELQSQYKQQEQVISALPPLPKFFLKRRIAEEEEIAAKKKFGYLKNLVEYSELWIEAIDEAIVRKTGLLISEA